jgi:fructose-specific phosphotransferase system IIC component
VRGVLTTILYILIGAFALAWILGAIWIAVGSLLEGLADWLESVQRSASDAAAWFHRHGV